MSRTTQEWEALLEGTTEGPWGWRWDEGLLAIIGPDGQTVAIDADVRDSDALAAAPDAVAEVIRLRRELEELLEVCDKVKDMRPADDYELGQHAGILQIGNTIANILNQEGKQ